MVPELSMSVALRALDLDEGPPELLSPEVSPRAGVPDDVDVHDPVLNVRIKMKSKELEMTEGLANYAVKRKAILCNDNHPMGHGQARSGCTLGHVCNQIHVKPGILRSYRDTAIKNGAEPKGFIKVVHAVDPVTKKKVGVKFGHTEDTMGRDKYRQLAVLAPSSDNDEGAPPAALEFCMAYLSAKGCPKKRKCPNIHVKHDEWRKQGCCNHHLAVAVGVEWGKDLVVNRGIVEKDKVIVTKGLKALAKGDNGPVTVPMSSLCKYHLDGYCKMNVSCDGVHVCRNLDLSNLTPSRPKPTGPFPLLFTPNGLVVPLECIEPTTGLSSYQCIPTPCQINICPNHLTQKGCQNKSDCHLVHVNPMWYSTQMAAAAVAAVPGWVSMVPQMMPLQGYCLGAVRLN